MRTLVMKFGGQSVGTTTALTQVLSIILHEHARWDRLIVVVSALEGVTDALLEAAHLAQANNKRGYRRITANLRTRHLALVEQLPLNAQERQHVEADVDRLIMELLEDLQTIATPNLAHNDAALFDRIASIGERLTARIITAMTRSNQIRTIDIDASTLIVTDDRFGNAQPDIDASCHKVNENLLPMLADKTLTVITGYIGATPDGNITTMGRGGSDYTASIMGICTQADEVWVWSHVDGMMTTDPKDIPDAQVIPQLAYHEVGEMAYFGARVLHAKMIQPIQQAQIPLRVKNVFKPQQPGTHISYHVEQTGQAKAVTTIQAIGLYHDGHDTITDITALMNRVFIETTGNSAEVMFTTQSAAKTFVCFIIPTTSGPDGARSTIETLHERLPDEAPDWTAEMVGVVTVVGDNLHQTQQIVAIYQQLGDTHPILGISQGTAHHNISIVTTLNAMPDVQAQLHTLITASHDSSNIK